MCSQAFRIRVCTPEDNSAVIALYKLVHADTLLSAHKSVRKFVKRAVGKKDLGNIQEYVSAPLVASHAE